MSSSKKIRNRLDDLFTKIIESEKEESASEVIGTPPISLPATPPDNFVRRNVQYADTFPAAPQNYSTSYPNPDFGPISAGPFLNIPFRSGDDWQSLQLNDDSHQNWQEEDQNLVRQIADQLGLALQNANLLRETQKTAQRLASVADIATNISSILELQPLLETAVRLTQKSFGLYHAHIFLFDNNEQTLIIKACGWENGVSHERMHEKREIDVNAGVSIVARAAREKRPVVDNNVHQDVHWFPNPILPNVQSEMAIPIIFGNRVLGVLNTHSDQLNYFTEADLSIMTTMAAQMGSAIENARLFDETQKRARELATLNNVVRSVSEQIGLNQVLEAAHKELTRLIPMDSFFVALYDAKSGMLEFPLVIDEDKLYSEQARQINPDSYTGRTILNGITIHENLVPEITTPATKVETFIGNKSKNSGSLIFVPLKLGQNVIGCISIQSYKNDTYSSEDIQLIENISSQLSAAILNARLFNQMQADEENFRNLVENAPEAIIVVDPLDGLLKDPNTNACKLFGLPAEKLIRLRPIDLSPEFQPDSRPSLELLNEKFNTVLDGNSIAFEWMIKDFHGNHVPCEIHLSRLPGDRPLIRATLIDITERKTAEAEILKFKMGIERSGDSVFMTDINGTIIYINPAFTEVYGYSAEEAIGKTPRIIKSGLLTRDNYQQFWATLLDKRTISGEIINRAKDGRLLTIAGTNSAILDEAGKIQGFLAVHHDVTSAKLAEEAMRKSEAELRALFAAMKDVVIVYDDQGRYLRIAPTDPSLLVKPPDDLIGKTLHDVFPPTEADRLVSIINSVIATNKTEQVEYSLEINNQIYWFEGVVSPMEKDAIVWVARDVTESKKAQKLLQENDEKLRRQNEYLAAAADVSRLVTSTLEVGSLFKRTVDLIKSRFGYYFVSIFTLDDNNGNAVMREGTGEVGEEMKARHHFLPVGSKSIIGNVTSSGETVIVNNTQVDSIHRPNPLLPDTLAEAGIPLNIGSRILGALDIQAIEVDAFHSEDIAVLETLADQIAIALDNANSYDLAQKAVVEMRELDRLKSQFLANMSHELRTPLNSIIGFSRVILKGIDGPITDQQHQDLNAIYNSGQHLLGLINDILDLSKIDAGKMELSLEELNIVDTINSVMSTAVGLVKDKPVKLKTQVNPDLPTVRADPMRIRQVLLNLISNASKFTEEGTVIVTAEVQTGSDNRQEVLVSVTDTGPGISEEDQSKLFLAFSQVDSSPTRKTGGTGLGLSICQRLVDLHGGQIGVHSKLGEGSSFYFTIPLFHQSNQVNSAVSNRTILCVETDPRIITIYERFLQAKSYEIVPVVNPNNVLEMASRLMPLAIILDVDSLGTNKWSILAKLKDDPTTKNIPVIICNIAEQEEKGYCLNAADYLLKPIRAEDLLGALTRLNSENKISEILIIDNSVEELDRIEKILLEDGLLHPMLAIGLEKGLEALTNQPPHAIILSMMLPELEEIALLEKINLTSSMQNIPVIFMTPKLPDEDQLTRLEKLTEHYSRKGMVSETQLFIEIEKHLRSYEQT